MDYGLKCYHDHAREQVNFSLLDILLQFVLL